MIRQKIPILPILAILAKIVKAIKAIIKAQIARRVIL
ncbi:hypothetical protein CGSMWGv6119V5_01473 [Gardnerella vaginalis 6119V5]|nr:hypothetical protein CGSMWGv6119V5_01473 [Gardnerella vaginalis 6119V5]